MGLLQELNLKPGVIYGDDVLKLFTYAKDKGFAIPAINVVRPPRHFPLARLTP